MMHQLEAQLRTKNRIKHFGILPQTVEFVDDALDLRNFTITGISLFEVD
jgi:hypothetical protein